jgi:hypothetical protein
MTVSIGLSLSLLLSVQAAGAPSQKDIDAAVKRGTDYLKTAPSPGGHLKDTDCDELILLTLIHAGMPEQNPVFQKLLKNVLSAPLKYTYKVALQAMLLEDLDPAYYQPRIAQCAQFLVDNQATNGQWSYGRETDAVASMPTLGDRGVESGEKKKPGGAIQFGAERVKTKPSKTIAVTQTKTTGEGGDNSNTQYAALGLRACHDAKIKIPDNVLHLARRWWVESQHPPEDGLDAKAESSGGGARPAGWNYKSHTNDERKPYHAMTAGAVGATVIYEYMMGRDWKKDKITNGGVAWLAKNWSVNTNYYYMYALERAGILYGVESIGNHNWYFEGARVLLQNQNGDGSWGKRAETEENTWDTCFAILFLKKATKAIATDSGKRK